MDTKSAIYLVLDEWDSAFPDERKIAAQHLAWEVESLSSEIHTLKLELSERDLEANSRREKCR